jgi:hypothetical protein
MISSRRAAPIMARALSIPPTNKAVYMAATDSPPTSPYSLASLLGPYMTGERKSLRGDPSLALRIPEVPSAAPQDKPSLRQPSFRMTTKRQDDDEETKKSQALR